MNGAAEGRGPDGGRSAGRAVKVYAADGLRGEECPGVMSGRVSVVEGDPVEVDVVVAVGKAAEEGLGLAEADAVTGRGEGVWRHIDDFAVVGDGRREVLNEGWSDDGARGGGVEQGVHGSERGGDGADRVGLDCNLLGDVADMQRDGDVLVLPGGELHGAATDCEAGREDFDGVAAGREAAEGEVSLRIDLDGFGG